MISACRAVTGFVTLVGSFTPLLLYAVRLTSTAPLPYLLDTCVGYVLPAHTRCIARTTTRDDHALRCSFLRLFHYYCLPAAHTHPHLLPHTPHMPPHFYPFLRTTRRHYPTTPHCNTHAPYLPGYVTLLPHFAFSLHLDSLRRSFCALHAATPHYYLLPTAAHLRLNRILFSTPTFCILSSHLHTPHRCAPHALHFCLYPTPPRADKFFVLVRMNVYRLVALL